LQVFPAVQGLPSSHELPSGSSGSLQFPVFLSHSPWPWQATGVLIGQIVIALGFLLLIPYKWPGKR